MMTSLFPPNPPLTRSYQVTWQEEICDPLTYRILMPAVPAYQLPFHNLRLHEERVQIFQHLLIGLEFLCRGWLLRKLGEAQL